MKYKLSVSLLPLLLLLNGCMTTYYVGDRFPASADVDVFYAAKDVKREYKVIGHISEDAQNIGQEEKVKKRIIAKAMEVGADAVIILGLDSGTGESSKGRQKAEVIQYTDKD